MKAQDTAATGNRELVISPPNFKTAIFRLRGTAPFVQLRFGTKAKEQMREKQEAGSTAKKGKARKAKDFDECYTQAMYQAPKGWRGIPASAFRNAMISACRTVDFKMTIAKLSVFVVADGYDKEDGTPLVKIVQGEPHHVEHAVRNATGVADIRVRAMWDEGWEADLRVQWDGAQFTVEDVANLIMRVGVQVGVGEGRPDSKRSGGMGWGLFTIVNKEAQNAQ